MKYLRSNLLRCWVILLVKICYYTLRIIRIKLWDIRVWPPRIRNKQTKVWFTSHAKPSDVYKKLYEANIANHPAPITLDTAIHPRLVAYAHEPQFEQFAAKITSTSLYWTYTTITSDNRILWDSVWYINESLYWNPHTYKILHQTCKKITWNIAVITGNDSYRNYNHWMTFGLPKYKLLLDSWFDVDYIITDNATKYHKESLIAAWIPQEKIIIPDIHTHITADSMIIMSTTTVSGNLPQRTISYLRWLFLPKTPQQRWKRLFLTRITTRCVVNEVEIMALLGPLWFEICILDDMSIADQATLFAQADIIVGPHGAWFTNIIFCNPGTKIIELFQPKTVWWHYYCLAASCWHTYWYIIWTEHKNPWRIAMDNNMYISPEDLSTMLKKMDII